MSDEPYRYINSLEDITERTAAEIKMRDYADRVGFGKRAFDKMVKAHAVKEIKIERDPASDKKAEHKTLFFDENDEMIELNTNWDATDYGIFRFKGNSKEYACQHPIYAKARLKNIDSGLESLLLKFKNGFKWEEVVVPRSTALSNHKVIDIGDYGVSVGSNNAKLFTEYLQELLDLNVQSIPIAKSSSRLGWYQDREIFLPYTEEIVYDGNSSDLQLFNSVKPVGNRDKQFAYTKEIWELGVEPMILLSASAAAPLVSIVEGLSNFIHLWSSKSSTGKTVILNTAASIWGKPKDYAQNFNATSNALEQTLATLNNLPLCIDEYQTASKYFNPYKLAQGQGRARANKDGSRRDISSWGTMILTNGESPIIKANDGEGAHARIMEVEVKAQLVDYETGNRISFDSNKNYGHIGYELVEYYKALTDEQIHARFSDIAREINSIGTVQQKHVGLGATLILGSEFLAKTINVDSLTVEDIEPYLLKKDEQSIGVRAYNYLLDFIASRKNKFLDGSNSTSYSDIYGQFSEEKTDNGYPEAVFIISSSFDEILTEAGFAPRSVLTELAEMGLIRTTGKENRFRTQRIINGQKVRCVELQLDNGEDTHKSPLTTLAEEFGWE